MAVAVPVGLAATTTSLLALWRFPPFQWIVQNLIARPLAEWQRREVHEDVIPIIQAELTHNGGMSIKDVVHRLDARVDDLAAKVSRIIEYRHEDMVLRRDRQFEVDRELQSLVGRLDSVSSRVQALLEHFQGGNDD
jgi:hypothetical protein